MGNNLSKRELNKSHNKATILEAAEELFARKGFENTSIEDVAKAADLTKRTLYQYFVSKEDLFYAVAAKGGRMLFAAYDHAFRQGKNALDKIRLGNMAYLDFYREHPGMFRVLNYQPANQQNSELSAYFREVEALNATRMGMFAELMKESRADGSINPNLETGKAVLFAFFAAFSLLYTASTTENGVWWDLLGFSEDEFLRFSFDLMADALK